jgi:hypothetical protein
MIINIYVSNKNNMFHMIEKPKLDACYICLDQICDAVFQFRCTHPVCVNCITKPETDNISFSILSKCGICRAKPNRYITESNRMCKLPYSDKQSIYVPIKMVTADTIYRDHIQHIIAHSY